ncbi:type III secretion system outer membrane ring subunit SctC [Trinickia sp. LjRoot230]|uniref:type III secretion system outer membrane ring subunit SctC n=1 Tax=Trinickia sp. LjRoot230 TaxID=3342288 RepID=UPI003ECDE30A
MNLAGVARLLVPAFVACTTIHVAHAKPIPWGTSRVHIAVEGKPIKEVLHDFASSEGIPAMIAQDVDGKVSGTFDMSPQAFLDSLASSFGFTWYFDGSTLEVTGSANVRTSTLKLAHASPDQLRDALDRLGVTDRRFPIQFDDAARTAVVSGTPHYIQLVSSVAQHLDDRAALSVGTQIKLFKLHHAWAADHDVNIGDKTVTIPGVANVLRSMYSQQEGSSPSQTLVSPDLSKVAPMKDVAGSTNGGSPLMPPLPGYSQGVYSGPGAAGLMPTSARSPDPLRTLLGGGANDGATRNPAPSMLTDSPMSSGAGTEIQPVIRADARTNSVLIRDVPERMAQYADIIEQLDVKPRLIEIEAHIIEIDDTALEQLGVDWRLHNSHFDLQTGTGTTGQNGYTGTLNPTFGTTNIGTNSTAVAATPAGLAMTAVLGDAGRYLLSRINALAQTNQAKIDASPKVTTLDNIQAVMDAKQQVFVRVQGYTAGDLYSISTGVSLRVLPMVVEENGQTQIKLEVSIENGAFSATQTVDAIPVVQTSQINTQAFVPEGQSLLIAGYRSDQNSFGVSGIPVLSKIPLIGGLFRTHDKNRSHMEQLFLLSPRIVDLQ